MMRVALPVWNGRISPVFDTAKRLLAAHLEGGSEIKREEIEIIEKELPQKANRIFELEIRLVICGAISRPFAAMLASYDIDVIPWVMGEADQVLQAYYSGELTAPGFRMPGCRRRGRHRRRGGFGCGHPRRRE